MTLAEISALNVPTFEAALAIARGRIGIYVDVKKAVTADLLAAIDKHEILDRVVATNQRGVTRSRAGPTGFKPITWPS